MLQKFAVVSNILPPSPSGQSTMLYKLLEGIPVTDYCLISGRQYNTTETHPDFPPKLPARYYWLKSVPRLYGLDRWGLWVFRKLYNFLPTFLWQTLQIATIIKKEKCKAIISCTGDVFDMPASYLASRLTRTSLYAYIFDYYLYQWLDPMLNNFMGKIEPIIIKGAKKVIVTNEFMYDEYYKHYGIASTIIRNPCDTSYNISKIVPLFGEIRIVYTGAVYVAHYDAFLNLIEAINILDRSDIKLHIYSASNTTEMEQVGIRGPVEFHPHLGLNQIAQAQRDADILFLPLAFKSPYPFLIRTSAPGKMGEYLMSGRPILVHAPGDSFLSWYFRKNQCGLVVDQNSPKLLADGITRLMDSPELLSSLVTRAIEQGKVDFDINLARVKFLSIFE